MAGTPSRTATAASRGVRGKEAVSKARSRCPRRRFVNKLRKAVVVGTAEAPGRAYTAFLTPARATRTPSLCHFESLPHNLWLGRDNPEVGSDRLVWD